MQARRELTVPLFQRTLDCVADGVLLIGPARNIVYASRPFLRLWNIWIEAWDKPFHAIIEHRAKSKNNLAAGNRSATTDNGK